MIAALSLPALAATCLGVAVLYMFWAPGLGPDAATALPRWRFIVLRWFHPLVWLLLASSFSLRGTNKPLADAIGFAALAAYLTFLACFIHHRLGQKNQKPR